MSWVRKVSHPSEVVNKGDKVTCVVLNVDQERKRIALGLKQMANDPWEGDIPGRYQPGRGQEGQGHQAHQLRRLRRAGAGLEGLLHISELADHKVESPEDVVKVGDEIEVKVLRVDAADRKIGLSRKRLGWTKEEEERRPRPTPRPPRRPAPAAARAARRHRLRRAPLFELPPPGEKVLNSERRRRHADCALKAEFQRRSGIHVGAGFTSPPLLMHGSVFRQPEYRLVAFGRSPGLGGAAGRCPLPGQAFFPAEFSPAVSRGKPRPGLEVPALLRHLHRGRSSSPTMPVARVEGTTQVLLLVGEPGVVGV